MTVRVFRHVNFAIGGLEIIGRRRDGRGEPTYTVGVLVPRERLEDLIVDGGPSAVKDYENHLKSRIIAELETNPEPYLKQPHDRCTFIPLDSPFLEVVQ